MLASRRAELCRDPLALTGEPEELAPVALGYPVDPVDVLLDQVGEQLQQGHARVVQVVIGPAGREARDQRARLLDEVVPAARVEIECGERHQSAPPTSRMR